MLKNIDAAPPASSACFHNQRHAVLFTATWQPYAQGPTFRLDRRRVVCDMRNLSSLRFVMRWLLLVYLISFGSVSLLNAQPPTPTISLPRAIYAPKPVY